MDELLTDQQQVEQVRGWVRENGPFLVAGVVLGLGALFGWNQWNHYQARKAEEASASYESFRQTARANDLDKAEADLRRLASDYGASPYVDQARLVVARLSLDRGKPDKATEYLEEVVNSGVSDEIRNIARLRLARVLNFREKHDESLKVLAGFSTKAFAPAVHDVRGDVYLAMGKTAEARSEYEQALNGDPGGQLIDRAYVQAKLDDLGGAAAALAGAADVSPVSPGPAAVVGPPATPAAPAP